MSEKIDGATEKDTPKFKNAGWAISIIALVVVALIYFSQPPDNNKVVIADPNKKYISTDFAAMETYYKSLTQVQQKEYMSRVEGELVRWSGKVDDVTDTIIYLAAGKYGTIRNLEVKLSNTETVDRKKLVKGQELTVEGKISNAGGLLTNWRVVDAIVIR